MKIKITKIIPLAILWIFLWNSASAQVLKYFNVTKLPNKNFGLNTHCTDVDASLIIILSPLEGLTFGSSYKGILSQDYNEAEKRYYICIKNIKQTIYIQKNDFLEDRSLKIEKIPEAKSIFYYNVTEKQSEVNVELGEFYLTTKPPGATIKIMGMPDFNKTTPYTFSGYEAKGYKISLTLENYDKLDTTITIKKEGKNQQKIFELSSAIGFLNFDIDPNQVNTKISINGSEISYVSGELYKTKKGKNKISISAEHFITAESELMVTANKTFNIDCKLKPKMGTFTLNLQNDEGQEITADYFIDEVEATEKKLIKYPVQEGNHRLKVECKGYAIKEIEFNINANENTQEDLVLLKEQTIYINTTPPDAVVYIDQSPKKSGKTPMDLTLKMGTHHIKIEKEGYQTFEDKFSMKLDKTEYNYKLISLEYLSTKAKARKQFAGMVFSSIAFAGLGYASFMSYTLLSKSNSDYRASEKNDEATQLHKKIVTNRTILTAAVTGTVLMFIPVVVYTKKYKYSKKYLKNYSQLLISPLDDGLAMSLKYNF